MICWEGPGGDGGRGGDPTEPGFPPHPLPVPLQGVKDNGRDQLAGAGRDVCGLGFCLSRARDMWGSSPGYWSRNRAGEICGLACRGHVGTIPWDTGEGHVMFVACHAKDMWGQPPGMQLQEQDRNICGVAWKGHVGTIPMDTEAPQGTFVAWHARDMWGQHPGCRSSSSLPAAPPCSVRDRPSQGRSVTRPSAHAVPWNCSRDVNCHLAEPSLQ